MTRLHIQEWIERYHGRVAFGEFLRRAAEWLSGFLLIFGACLLVARLLLPQLWPGVLLVALGVVPAIIMAWRIAHRAGQTRAESVAGLDRALDTGGLLMTVIEQPDDAWSARLPQSELVWREALPKLRPKRFASALILPLCFAIGAAFVPLRAVSKEPVRHGAATAEVGKQLNELFTAIRQTSAAEKEEQQQLEREIEKLGQQTEKSPLTQQNWEVVDALQERMRTRLESAAVNLQQLQHSVSLLAHSADDGAALTLDESVRLEKEVSETLQKLLEKGAFSNASPEMQDELRRLVKMDRDKLNMDPAERQALLEKLSEHLAQEQKKLAALRKKCSSCGGMCDSEGNCLSDGHCEGNRPGRGGVNRGRGDAELTYGDEADAAGAKFKETVLPRGFSEQPKDDVQRVEKRAPTDEPAASAPRGPARDVDAATGASTWNRRSNPKHREVIRKFFDKQSP